MAGNSQSSSDGVKHRHRPEGPEKHVVAFIFSIALTLIAFAAVAGGGINNTFTIVILLVMAVLQVFIQMAYWMHMKDKGHFIPILFMAFGFFVAFTAIITALLWMWW